jgi:hypothetical protein
MSEKVFKSIASLEEVLEANQAKPQDLELAKTENGKFLLLLRGEPFATLKNNLKGETVKETAEKLKGINICFGIPKDGAVDINGRKALPCAMEQQSTWETVPLF